MATATEQYALAVVVKLGPNVLYDKIGSFDLNTTLAELFAIAAIDGLKDTGGVCLLHVLLFVSVHSDT